MPGQRQSNIDFYSFRRWFVRKALYELKKEAKGFTPWTIAEVIDHSVENASLERQKLPLGLTLRWYAGDVLGAGEAGLCGGRKAAPICRTSR